MGSNTNTSKNTISEDEIIDIAETVTECADEFNHKFNTASHEEGSFESESTSQGDKKKIKKRKFKSEENAEEPDDDGQPKEKVTKSEVKLTEEDYDLQCSICKELFIKAVTLTCGHTFCRYCIDQWRMNPACCPICRAEIDRLSPSVIIDNLIEKIIDKCSAEVKERRVKLVEERTPANNVVEKFILIDSDDEDDESSKDEDEDIDVDEHMITEGRPRDLLWWLRSLF